MASTELTVKITPNDHGNPPGKLADAELHFAGGPLDGLKLIGFSIWERRAAAVATSRSPPVSTPSTASAAALRSCVRSLISRPSTASATRGRPRGVRRVRGTDRGQRIDCQPGRPARTFRYLELAPQCLSSTRPLGRRSGRRTLFLQRSPRNRAPVARHVSAWLRDLWWLDICARLSTVHLARSSRPGRYLYNVCFTRRHDATSDSSRHGEQSTRRADNGTAAS
jgi:hypothetical protein